MLWCENTSNTSCFSCAEHGLYQSVKYQQIGEITHRHESQVAPHTLVNVTLWLGFMSFTSIQLEIKFSFLCSHVLIKQMHVVTFAFCHCVRLFLYKSSVFICMLFLIGAHTPFVEQQVHVWNRLKNYPKIKKSKQPKALTTPQANWHAEGNSAKNSKDSVEKLNCLCPLLSGRDTDFKMCCVLRHIKPMQRAFSWRRTVTTASLRRAADVLVSTTGNNV